MENKMVYRFIKVQAVRAPLGEVLSETGELSKGIAQESAVAYAAPQMLSVLQAAVDYLDTRIPSATRLPMDSLLLASMRCAIDAAKPAI